MEIFILLISEHAGGVVITVNNTGSFTGHIQL
jgi:hypothetical protein